MDKKLLLQSALSKELGRMQWDGLILTRKTTLSFADNRLDDDAAIV